MRGGVTLIITAILAAILGTSLALRCDREPEGRTAPRSPADSRFRLKISGNPDKYVPEESYTVTLKGEMTEQSAAKFTRFMISVESNEMISSSHSPPVGEFAPTHDVYTKISERCPNAITESSPTVRKTDVHARWTAPPTGSGCVIFRAMVMELPNLWYMDDGPLSRIICEEVQENDDEQPKVVEPCCACDEAKYEVTFEGLWSRHTHPKDFPVNSWLTRFSDVIGASHTAAYRFWDYGKFASDGLQQVAERGATPRLESELKAQSEHIRTIIKARGISYPNVTGKTFAVFRVDRKHHLMSIVSMIDPSPDWIVGVSGLELCLRNCSWVDHKVLNLYPWDVGTDSGITYISSDYPTLPKESIRRITSSFPNDPLSPFYDPTGEEMKPLARLHLTRQRLYEKSCDNELFGPNKDEDWPSYDTPDDCAVSEWNDWNSCSVSCGRGSRLRQRFYLNDNKANMKMCNQRLTARATCYGEQRNCGNPRKAPEADPNCAMTDWGGWSECSETCGLARRMRTRKYKLLQYRKRCEMAPGAQNQQQSDTCYDLPACDGEEPPNPNEPEDTDCPMTEWSDWSPCNVSCGKGRSISTRALISMEGVMGNMYAHCKKMSLKLTEDIPCEADHSCEMTSEEAREACQMKKESGPCRGDVVRWFFDTLSESCQKFQYSCRGNKNNFITKEDCEKICLGYQDSEPTTVDPFNGLKPGSHVIDTSPSSSYGLSTLPTYPGDDLEFPPIPGAVINCQVSNWTAWSPCDTTCGLGYKTRTRHIKVQRKNGGHPCPKKLLKKKRCKVTGCEEVEHHYSHSQNGDSRKETDQYPTWGNPQTPHRRGGDGSGGLGIGGTCEYSDWSEWTQCSMSCGPNAQQQRTRKTLRNNISGGQPCGNRLEMRECDLLPCNA